MAKILILKAPILKKSTNRCFWFFKTATEQRWAGTPVLNLLGSSDNLLTGYWVINNLIEIYQFVFH